MIRKTHTFGNTLHKACRRTDTQSPFGIYYLSKVGEKSLCNFYRNEINMKISNRKTSEQVIKITHIKGLCKIV